MKRIILGWTMAAGLFGTCLAQVAVAEDAAKSEVKLLEAKPITAGHRVIPLFPAGRRSSPSRTPRS
jgi:hypothetical protein